MMHQSEFHAANVALSRAADKRKSLINIHNNRYTATLMAASSVVLCVGCWDDISHCLSELLLTVSCAQMVMAYQAMQFSY